MGKIVASLFIERTKRIAEIELELKNARMLLESKFSINLSIRRYRKENIPCSSRSINIAIIAT